MNNEDYKKIDQSQYTNSWWKPGRNRFIIALWRSVGMLLFRLIPSEPMGFLPFFNGLKASLLRLFGAKIGKGLVIRSTSEIYYPWNLEIGDHVWIGYGTNIYTLVKIRIGNHVAISHNVFLCTGSHDISDPYMGLIVGEIHIGDGA